MTLSGNIREDDWSVEVETRPDGGGGFRCRVQVEHGVGAGRFHHAFEHSESYPTEREAVLAGLRAGMTWIELKRSQTFNV
ncbi:UDP-glucose 4-epimerase [Burkholderia multivorans]|uniref:UDP-glucose 4-epimerase n=1 Tax=Burkholderia ubonensis TaxID=101571 RepID=UPI000F6DD552|nr:UDP-glucose 4-epimerase [Burkholderia ubonensis]AYZ62074.1 UDP-glucose 4-epimerase [Burkholderia multivorans]VWB27496.1 UDP-glucose 4-epimerase [Burkholderia ubonensis]